MINRRRDELGWGGASINKFYYAGKNFKVGLIFCGFYARCDNSKTLII